MSKIHADNMQALEALKSEVAVLTQALREQTAQADRSATAEHEVSTAMLAQSRVQNRLTWALIAAVLVQVVAAVVTR